MNRWKNSLVAAALVLAAASTFAYAQNEEGRGRGGRLGGMGRGGGVDGLISMKEVQAELKLSEEDAKKLADKLAELRPQRGEGGGGRLRDFQNLSEEEREKRMAEFRARMEETAKKVDELLKAQLSPEQYQRLRELRVQREGLASLDRPQVAEELKLTAEQKEKIRKLLEENRPRFGQRRGAGGPPNREEMQQRRQKLRTDVLAVLTEEQKSAWEKLKGAEFKFPQPEGGGRRNRPAAE